MRSGLILLGAALCLTAAGAFTRFSPARATAAADVPAEGEKPVAAAQAKQALQAAQGYVGAWRGVGQIRRGSADGSWIEEADWAWQFDKDSAALTFSAPKARYYQTGRLVAGQETGSVRLECHDADGKVVATFAGKFTEGGELVLLNPQAAADAPARISFRTVAGGDRLVVLLERRLGETERYLRMAEIGYTRQGSNFGQASVGRECVVTGGAGTIAVTHNGQTYYVCCTGCRDYFNDDPEAVLAEYRAKKVAEKEQK